MFYSLFLSPLLISPTKSTFNPQTKRARDTVRQREDKEKPSCTGEVPAIYPLQYIHAAVLLKNDIAHWSDINPF